MDPSPRDASIPALRWRGMNRARAPIIAVIEDHSVPPPEWAHEVIEGDRLPYEIVAGPVENRSRNTLFDWAFFLLEYAPFMPPLTAAVVPAAPGGNISYKEVGPASRRGSLRVIMGKFSLRRASKQRSADLLAPTDGDGGTATPSPSANSPSSATFFLARWRRCVSNKRLWLPGCFFGAGAALVLPVLLLLRLARTVWAKGRNRREFAAALPWVLLFVCCGVAGEALGAWLGEGGSLRRVK